MSTTCLMASILSFAIVLPLGATDRMPLQLALFIYHDSYFFHNAFGANTLL
jgi:hypothetical protein